MMTSISLKQVLNDLTLLNVCYCQWQHSRMWIFLKESYYGRPHKKYEYSYPGDNKKNSL